MQYFKEKGIINAILASCLFVVELVIGCLISGDFIDRINYKEETALTKAECDETKEEIEVIKEKNADPEVEEQNVVEPIDIESEIDEIRNMYNVFQNNKGNYQLLEVNDQVTAYLDSYDNVAGIEECEWKNTC